MRLVGGKDTDDVRVLGEPPGFGGKKMIDGCREMNFGRWSVVWRMNASAFPRGTASNHTILRRVNGSHSSICARDFQTGNFQQFARTLTPKSKSIPENGS
ncbi:hypothetical protein TNIN_27451 [Trichonephila inaurata madagascariensis]|uniref:Uncharacterized protein n=1 Tax=Trichonephila inaurata madagascariensis TaxID=2747483 RepID=A0A8X7BY38_9ARAC|nr:hypothetical protein TNIN_27451 [Trichonephila inaurata madagascariensis]